jgi:hypothetical protein
MKTSSTELSQLLKTTYSLQLNPSLEPLCTDHTENTASIVKNACLLIRYLAVDILMLRAFTSAGMYLPSRCLAMGIHVIILIRLITRYPWDKACPGLGMFVVQLPSVVFIILINSLKF